MRHRTKARRGKLARRRRDTQVITLHGMPASLGDDDGLVHVRDLTGFFDGPWRLSGTAPRKNGNRQAWR